MTSRTTRLACALLIVCALSACSTEGAAGGGAIELAVSEVCDDVAAPQCVSIDGQSVVLPTAFERAGVTDVAVSERGGQSELGVTFSSDGVKVFRALTEQAVDAGHAARLVIKIGDELRAAVVVQEVIEADQVQIMLPPGDSAPEAAELIRAG